MVTSQEWKGPLELFPKLNPSFTRQTEEEAAKHKKTSNRKRRLQTIMKKTQSTSPKKSYMRNNEKMGLTFSAPD